jgi:hypothetical protein
MPILIDPEEHESNALLNLPIAWTGKSVLEIGSGDGRLTWRFANKVNHVIAIEPDAEKHAAALAGRPSGLEHVEFLNLGLDEFYKYVTLSEAKSLKNLSKETLRSLRFLTPSRRPYGKVTQDKKFDLALLSWSL